VSQPENLVSDCRAITYCLPIGIITIGLFSARNFSSLDSPERNFVIDKSFYLSDSALDFILAEAEDSRQESQDENKEKSFFYTHNYLPWFLILLKRIII